MLKVFVLVLGLLCGMAGLADGVFNTTAMSAPGVTGPADSEQTKEFSLKAHKKFGFDCATCHGDMKSEKDAKPLTNEQCLSCHGSYAKVSKRTGFLDKDGTNPHNGFHHADKLDCIDCHREHRPSRNYCASCHDAELWTKPTP